MTEPRSGIARMLARHRVVICVGTGGVGKTTIAAALGVLGALSGRRTMVLTIDPARQLARALGLAKLSSAGEPVPRAALTEAGLSPTLALHAAMLDERASWDAFVRRHATDPATRDALLSNRFYAQLSTSLSGSTEYMAIEELCRLDDSGRYDLLVIDTPPAAHALDFFRAPERVEKLLDAEVVRWLSRPYAEVGRGAYRALSVGVQTVIKQLERVAGSSTLREISAFFLALEALFGDVAGRAARARALLHADTTAFVLVAGPTERGLSEGQVLLNGLGTLSGRFAATVVNRVHPLGARAEGAIEALLDELAAVGAPAAAIAWLAGRFREAVALDRAERERLAEFQDRLPPHVAWAEISELDHDAHCLRDLLRVAESLRGPEDGLPPGPASSA